MRDRPERRSRRGLRPLDDGRRRGAARHRLVRQRRLRLPCRRPARSWTARSGSALARGVEVGAHVGFPDRQGFGRRVMQIEPGRTGGDGDLPARRAGRHRPRRRAPDDPHELPRRARQHGGRRRGAGRAAGRGGGAVRPGARRSSPRRAGRSRTRPRAAACGSRPRSWPTAPATATGCSCRAASRTRCMHDEAVVLERVRRLLRDGVVETYDGSLLPMRPHSILLHGDTPGAVALGTALRTLVR